MSEGKTELCMGPPETFCVSLRDFPGLAPNCQSRRRAGAPEEDVRDVNTKLACGMTYWPTVYPRNKIFLSKSFKVDTLYKPVRLHFSLCIRITWYL